MTDEIKSKKPIWKRRWVWIIIFFVAIIIIASSGGEKKETKLEITQPAQEKTTQPVQEKARKSETQEQPQKATWQKVKSWQGTGIKNTEPFTITGKQWRIVWSLEDTTGFGGSILQIFVYKPGGELPIEMVANAQGTASDTGYVYKSGEFYLNINSANGKWVITVEELR